jgi:hypothetical protein
MSLTSEYLMQKLGPPAAGAPWMVMWDIPKDLEVGVIPKKLWCNKALIEPGTTALINLITRGYAESELLTFDGCFNIRPTTSQIGKNILPEEIDWSLHSWAVAWDFNAFENGYGKKPKLSTGFVQCFTDAGFRWGGKFSTPDGMHFELKNI